MHALYNIKVFYNKVLEIINNEQNGGGNIEYLLNEQSGGGTTEDEKDKKTLRRLYIYLKDLANNYQKEKGHKANWDAISKDTTYTQNENFKKKYDEFKKLRLQVFPVNQQDKKADVEKKVYEFFNSIKKPNQQKGNIDTPILSSPQQSTSQSITQKSNDIDLQNNANYFIRRTLNIIKKIKGYLTEDELEKYFNSCKNYESFIYYFINLCDILSQNNKINIITDEIFKTKINSYNNAYDKLDELNTLNDSNIISELKLQLNNYYDFISNFKYINSISRKIQKSLNIFIDKFNYNFTKDKIYNIYYLLHINKIIMQYKSNIDICLQDIQINYNVLKSLTTTIEKNDDIKNYYDNYKISNTKEVIALEESKQEKAAPAAHTSSSPQISVELKKKTEDFKCFISKQIVIFTFNLSFILEHISLLPTL